MQFYNMSKKRKETVSDKDVKYINKKTKRGNTIRMATAKSKDGDSLFKIVKKE